MRRSESTVRDRDRAPAGRRGAARARRRFLLTEAARLAVALALASSLGACGDEPTCANAGCGATEICVRSENVVSCQPLPAACFADRRCSCLEGQASPDFNLPACLRDGGCRVLGDTLEVSCPSD